MSEPVGPESEAAEVEAASDTKEQPRDLDFRQARLAYSIIESLLDHTRIVSDLLALMAQVLDEETTRAVTNTPHWKAYMESRRQMERTRENVEKFAAVMRELGGDEDS
jgi:hypothetical protein